MKSKSLLCLFGLLAASLVQAEVRVEGPVEYGVFAVEFKDPQPGERLLTRANQPIRPGAEVPARLGTKFGVRYRLSGKTEGQPPLPLLYFTPGLVGPDGQRQDKIEVTQALLPGVEQDVMAFEFTEAYEVVPGEWRFMVFQGDRRLLEQRFDVR